MHCHLSKKRDSCNLVALANLCTCFRSLIYTLPLNFASGYVRGCAALCVIVCFTDFFGSVLTGLGLRSTDPNKKYKYYRVAIYCLVLCGNGRA